MFFLLFELFFLMPFCLGRVVDNGSSQNIEKKVTSISKEGPIQLLRPSLNIRNGPSKVIEILAGDNKRLECEAGGSPPPTIHWLKDGEKIAQSFYEAIHPEENEVEVGTSRLGLGFTRSRLYIDCASSKDEGKYTCVAENEYFRDSKTAQVFVADLLDRENSAICLDKKTYGSPARIHMWTQNRLEMMNTDVQLFCRHSGDPEPQVIWRGPNGTPLPETHKYKMMENGDLIIRDLDWTDMGGYTCSVKNQEGTDDILVFLYPTAPDVERVAKA